MKKGIPPSHSPYDCSFAVCSCRAIRKASNSLETSRALCQEYWSSIGVRGTLHAKRTMYKTLKVEITNPDEIFKSLKTITWLAAHIRLGHMRKCYSSPSPWLSPGSVIWKSYSVFWTQKILFPTGGPSLAKKPQTNSVHQLWSNSWRGLKQELSKWILGCAFSIISVH